MMKTSTEITSEILKTPRQLLQERSFAKRYPDNYNELLSWDFPYGFTFTQKLYHYLHDDKTLVLGLCPVCGNRCKFKNFTNGYCTHCSTRCSTLDKNVQGKRIATSITIYGTEHPNQSDVSKNKAKRTCLERYGVENAAKSDKIKEKIKASNKDKYGVEYYQQTEDFKRRVADTWESKTENEKHEISAKRKGTLAATYGDENYNNREKSKRTCEEIHGDENYNNREKFKHTCEERYGVENVFQLQKTKEKSITTRLEKYGAEYYQQTDEFKKRVCETWENKPQEELDEIRLKIESIMKKKYGVRNYAQTEEFKAMVRETWGNKPRQEIESINTARQNTCSKKYGTEFYSETDEWKDKVNETNIKKYGVPWVCMRPEARNYKSVSKINTAFAEQLTSNDIQYEMEFPLGSYSYDFKVGGTLIEINPTITHNSYLNIFGGEPKKHDYHSNKSKRASDNSYRCIHIWDWDDWNKILNMLKPKQTLYARKLVLKEVGEAECNEFLNTYHIQNTCRGQSIRLGLYMNDILVELMTFGKPRYNKNYEYELLRLCSHSDYIVVGGAERLFKHFVEQHNPASVISYCDASKFDGKVYERLGFELKYTSKPTKHWWDGKHHITDNFLRQRGFDQLFGTQYGKGTDNNSLMLAHKFLPVYDCGQMSFVWHKK